MLQEALCPGLSVSSVGKFFANKLLIKSNMINIDAQLQDLIALVGEETAEREIEGLIRKHLAIAARRPRKGAVSQEGERLLQRHAAGMVITPRAVAERALARSLSQASLYRLVRLLRNAGLELRPRHVRRELERLKKGVY